MQPKCRSCLADRPTDAPESARTHVLRLRVSESSQSAVPHARGPTRLSPDLHQQLRLNRGEALREGPISGTIKPPIPIRSVAVGTSSHFYQNRKRNPAKYEITLGILCTNFLTFQTCVPSSPCQVAYYARRVCISGGLATPSHRCKSLSPSGQDGQVFGQVRAQVLDGHHQQPDLPQQGRIEMQMLDKLFNY